MTSCRRDRKLAAITEVARLALCKEGVFDPWVDWEGHAKRRPEAFVELLAAYLAQACRELVSADDNDRGNRRSKLGIVCDAKRCMSMYRLTSSRDVPPVPLQDLADICGQYLWTTDPGHSPPDNLDIRSFPLSTVGARFASYHARWRFS